MSNTGYYRCWLLEHIDCFEAFDTVDVTRSLELVGRKSCVYRSVCNENFLSLSALSNKLRVFDSFLEQ